MKEHAHEELFLVEKKEHVFKFIKGTAESENNI